MSSATATRVVVTDDSPMMRQIVSRALANAGIDVVGEAADGDEALARCEQLTPDALMLDLSMPGRDGIGVLKALQQREHQLPVIVVSAFSPTGGARAVDALAEGAFDLVAKPAAGESLDSFAANLVEKVKAATAEHNRPAAKVPPRRTFGTASSAALKRAVVIATSTGGPRALAALIPALPAPLGNGTLVVQHMPPGFTSSLAARLNTSSELTVREAQAGDRLDPDVALLAPGGKHLRITHDGEVRVTDDPEIGRLRPRADLTIKDAASAFGEKLLLVVMTGMGNDGLIGAREVKRRGGRVLIQDQASCTVYGMPRVVAEANLADRTLPLDELPAAIVEECCA